MCFLGELKGELSEEKREHEGKGLRLRSSTPAGLKRDGGRIYLGSTDSNAWGNVPTGSHILAGRTTEKTRLYSSRIQWFGRLIKEGCLQRGISFAGRGVEPRYDIPYHTQQLIQPAARYSNQCVGRTAYSWAVPEIYCSFSRGLLQQRVGVAI